MSYGRLDEPLVIYLQYPMVVCCICGVDAPSCWGVPVSDETAQIVANDFEGERGAAPACQTCWQRHEADEFVGTYPRF